MGTRMVCPDALNVTEAHARPTYRVTQVTQSSLMLRAALDRHWIPN